MDSTFLPTLPADGRTVAVGLTREIATQNQTVDPNDGVVPNTPFTVDFGTESCRRATTAATAFAFGVAFSEEPGERSSPRRCRPRWR